MLLVLAAACTGSSAPTTVATLAPTTSVADLTTTSPSTTVTPERWTVRVLLDPAEAAPLSPGVTIGVRWDGGSGVIRSGGMLYAFEGTGTRPSELSFSYVTADGATVEPSWTQPVGIGPFETVVQPWRGTRPPSTAGILMGWQAAGTTGRYVGELDAAPGLTVTSPVWWYLSEAGELTSNADAALVVAAHERGIAVWPAIASLDADRIAAGMAADPRALAKEVAAAARDVGADGVNVDFEGYRNEDAASVADFVEALATEVRAWDGVVSVDLIPRSDRWELTPRELEFWSSAPDRRRLAAAADYVVLMAYDQFNGYRPAGPVSSPAWVEETLRYLLRYADADRVILGVPFYGRVWDPDDLPAPRALSGQAIAGLAEAGTRSYDVPFGVDRVDLADGRFLWVENAVERAPGLVERYGLAGVAGWRLGLDDSSVWEVLAAS